MSFKDVFTHLGDLFSPFSTQAERKYRQALQVHCLMFGSALLNEGLISPQTLDLASAVRDGHVVIEDWRAVFGNEQMMLTSLEGSPDNITLVI